MRPTSGFKVHFYIYCSSGHFAFIPFRLVLYSIYTRTCIIVTYPFASATPRDNRKYYFLPFLDHTTSISTINQTRWQALRAALESTPNELTKHPRSIACAKPCSWCNEWAGKSSSGYEDVAFVKMRDSVSFCRQILFRPARSETHKRFSNKQPVDDCKNDTQIKLYYLNNIENFFI